jgi:hypothetical protein
MNDVWSEGEVIAGATFRHWLVTREFGTPAPAVG